MDNKAFLSEYMHILFLRMRLYFFAKMKDTDFIVVLLL